MRAKVGYMTEAAAIFGGIAAAVCIWVFYVGFLR